ncbi:hypothetical protein B0H16DRAFT_1847881 [Mycena metata]|uniref:CxC2-like cysteine cluster KDZ transposase-associated domain-containing protein n=1 Tax=Mycena metata TaxID=1033252 RepID=A0AAD7ISQ2_9AGAR|nr:hypothetical protein B0H16DRAFT_1847881 [Mycena metata]
MSRKRSRHDSMQMIIASDSEDEGDTEHLQSGQEDLFHRALRTDRAGHTTISTTVLAVPASPTKVRRPERDMLAPDSAPSATNWQPAEDVPFPFENEESFAFDEGHPVEAGPRKARKSDYPLTQWADERRERFLEELVRLEGRSEYRYQTKCAGCPANVTDAIYRCKDCFTDALFCKGCLVTIHKDNPLHRVEIWDGTFFTGLSLKSLGLRIQLGHGRSGVCPGTLAKSARAEEASARSAAARAAASRDAGNAGDGGERAADDGEGEEKQKRDDFCIVDSNGIHEVGLDFCSCSLAQDHDIQLLRARLYPATTTNPASAATFRVLRQFHLLSLEAKCSAHHFYNSLARATNNNGVFQPRNRYNEFRRMTREWRHLQMLKRTGRAHASSGVKGTKEGECALLCPACPQPGKNLPPDGSWRKVPKEKRFLYALFLALDANFRMKRKHVSSEEDDPSLGDGIAFYSCVAGYMKHLDEHWDDEQEKSTCVAHDAVNEPDREAYGTASSGIGTVDCARHNMKRPLGVGDLQKGERYINMDWMLWKSLTDYDELVQLFVSYDIVCQWHKNIWRRLAKYGPELRNRGLKRGYVWLIPKFHLPAHIEACNILYSFNLTPFVGQTDGEAPERGWANANPLANSTKEMGPGARRDALDDHFNDWNHKKIVGLGEFLLKRVQKAVENMSTYRLELLEAERGLPAEVVAEWTTAMELWEADPANPNPFKMTEKHESVQAIRGRLAQEAATAVVGDQADDVRGDVHATEMITMGMQLEEQQRELAFDNAALSAHATDRQRTALRERSNKLGRKITEWLKIREAFTLMVALVRAAEEKARTDRARLQPTPGVPVHAVKLWLPSRLTTVPDVEVKESHARFEFELRVGQAHEALEEVRRLLLVRTHQYHVKDDNDYGVAANTRAKTSIKAVDERTRRTSATYRAARLSLVGLGARLDETEWKRKLRVLTPDDVRQRPRATFSDPQHKSRKKRRRTQTPQQAADEARKKREEERPASWIWLSELSQGESEQAGMVEALRIEWAKTRARAWRWTEEVDLVEEEMRRVLQFLSWKAQWWLDLIDRRPNVTEDPVLHEGVRAYARRQSQIQSDLRARFEGNWADVAQYIQLGRDGLGEIPEEEGEEGEEGEEDDDPEAPVPEVARDTLTLASFVEESLA